MAESFVILLLYPRAPGTTFNTNYYLNHHIPLAKEIWSQYGFSVHSLTEMDSDSDYHLTGVLAFETEEGYQKAQADPRMSEIQEDIASGRFTKAQPVFLAGKRVL
jgi:uncharacterized protein (TIGR02118 family)